MERRVAQAVAEREQRLDAGAVVPAVTDELAGDSVTVSVDVKNTGGRAGSEVVQVDVEPDHDDPTRPIRTLAGFRKVRLQPGARQRVDIEAPPRAFQNWIDGEWRPAAGTFRVLVGRSSRDLVAAGEVDL